MPGIKTEEKFIRVKDAKQLKKILEDKIKNVSNAGGNFQPLRLFDNSDYPDMPSQFKNVDLLNGEFSPVNFIESLPADTLISIIKDQGDLILSDKYGLPIYIFLTSDTESDPITCNLRTYMFMLPEPGLDAFGYKLVEATVPFNLYESDEASAYTEVDTKNITIIPLAGESGNGSSNSGTEEDIPDLSYLFEEDSDSYTIGELE